MEEDTVNDMLKKIELQIENWKYEEQELATCSVPLVTVEGRRYD